MGSSKIALLTLFVLASAAVLDCKIILPHKLRYLENMLNSEVVAKAARIRQRAQANPNAPDADKSWFAALGKYQPDEKLTQPAMSYNNLYNRRSPNFN